jgi:hypothetical protein
MAWSSSSHYIGRTLSDSACTIIVIAEPSLVEN